MMKNRIDSKFQQLKEKRKKAMIAFVTSGYPSVEQSKDIILKMAMSGADIIELGIPYSDPIADGAVIQEASSKVLKDGLKIKDIMKMVAEIRKKTEIPLVYMVYFGCIYKYGIERFMVDSKLVGIDGIIIPDLPLEERKGVVKIADEHGIYIIPLIAPTSEERIKDIVEGAKGFIYCVSTNGVTGVRSSITTDINYYTNLVSKFTDVPKCIGFGISNADMADKVKDYFDGVIIGSAIMKIIENKEDVVEKVGEFVLQIKNVL